MPAFQSGSVTEQQWNLLLDEIGPDPELLSGDFTAPNGIVRVPQKWRDVSDKLNALPGAHKSGEKWKEVRT